MWCAPQTLHHLSLSHTTHTSLAAGADDHTPTSGDIAPTSYQQSTMILYYELFAFLAPLSAFGNLCCLCAIFWDGWQTLSSRLALCLHFTGILVNIGAFPFLFFVGESRGVCKFTGWLLAYAGVANATTILFMTLYALETLFSFSLISMRKEIWMITSIFGFPFISLLGFVEPDVYGMDHAYWCFYRDTKSTDAFAYGLFYDCILSIVLLVLIGLGIILFRFRQFPQIQMKVLRFLGLYSGTNMIFWLLRAVSRVYGRVHRNEPYDTYVAVLLSYLCGLCSVVVYLFERKSLVASEQALLSLKPQSSINDFRTTVGMRRSSFLRPSIFRPQKSFKDKNQLFQTKSGLWFNRRIDENGPDDVECGDDNTEDERKVITDCVNSIGSAEGIAMSARPTGRADAKLTREDVGNNNKITDCPTTTITTCATTHDTDTNTNNPFNL